MKIPKILVVGSFVMDQIGITSTVPKEGETIIGEEFKKAPGGKGANQAVQAARLGANVTLVGKVGDDSNGKELIKTCADSGINVNNIKIDEKTATGCSMLILQKVPGKPINNRILVLPGANMTLSVADVQFLDQEIDNYDIVMLQLEIPMAVNEYVANLAYCHNIPVMLNSAPSSTLSKSFLSHLTYISPNEHEAYDLTGFSLRDDSNTLQNDQVKHACEKLLSFGVKNVIITLGENGAVLMNSSHYLSCPAVKGTRVVDPTAAGDSFVGAFCYAKSIGKSDEDSLIFSNNVASITVSKMGAMPSLPSFEEVNELLNKEGGKPTCLHLN